MKMKKWLAVLMTLAVTTAGLAGCGASDKPAAQQESAEKTEAAETVSGETGSSEQAGGEKVNKVFAKLGSDMKKPDATTVIPIDGWQNIVWPQPLGNLLYAGRAATACMPAASA